MEAYNQKFSVEPLHQENAHRKELPDENTQKLLFSFQTERVISKQLEVHYNNRLFQIQHLGEGYRLQHKKILVCESINGEIYLLWNHQSLAFKEHHRLIKTPPVVDRKNIDHVFNTLQEKKQNIPAPNHPWRKYQLTQARKKAA